MVSRGKWKIGGNGHSGINSSIKLCLQIEWSHFPVVLLISLTKPYLMLGSKAESKLCLLVGAF